MSHSSNLEVLLIDLCFGDMGVANPMIPLPVGLIGSYLKKQIPEISVTVLKKSIRWMEDAPNKKLSEFKKVVTYYFKETKFSKLSKEKIWKSFGFNLSSKEKYNNQWFKRLWISRTQRRISRGDKDSSKQRMTHATSIAEKIGL